MKPKTSAPAPRAWAFPAALVLIGVGVLALVYVLLAPHSKPQPTSYAHFATGAMSKLVVLPAPPTQPAGALTDANGQGTTLAAFRGKVVLVNLWATWCAPCMEEMPTLAGLQRRFAGRNFEVVPVSVDSSGDVPHAKEVLARLSGGSLHFLNDPSRSMIFDAQAGAMPTSILYDAQGRELARVVGDTNWETPEAAALIEAALADQR
ncbi:MAG TPA: TlpA disulfide reductase family protein [Caulobacterales bacterium]|nr:TlpA disulfide reductase family protein [Caulobacterales bacterium]